jgi:hypothetical protein
MQPISTGRCRHIALRRAYRSESDRLAFAGQAMGRACEATKWALGNRAGPLFIGSGGAMAFRRSGQLIPEPFPTGQYTVTDDHWLLRRVRTDSPRPLPLARVYYQRCTYVVTRNRNDGLGSTAFIAWCTPMAVGTEMETAHAEIQDRPR